MTHCAYKRHRDWDWMLKDGTGPLTCGVCHPPAIRQAAIFRDALGWNRAVKLRERRVVEEGRRARDPFCVYDEEVPEAEPKVEPINEDVR